MKQTLILSLLGLVAAPFFSAAAERVPNAQGFQHFFGLLGGNHHYFKHMDRFRHHDLFLNRQPVTREGYTTDLLTDDATQFLRERRHERPFYPFSFPSGPRVFPIRGRATPRGRSSPGRRAGSPGRAIANITQRTK